MDGVSRIVKDVAPFVHITSCHLNATRNPTINSTTTFTIAATAYLTLVRCFRFSDDFCRRLISFCRLSLFMLCTLCVVVLLNVAKCC